MEQVSHSLSLSLYSMSSEHYCESNESIGRLKQRKSTNGFSFDRCAAISIYGLFGLFSLLLFLSELLLLILCQCVLREFQQQQQ